MSSRQDIFRAILKQQHLSITKARVTVFEALLGQEPLSMQELTSRATEIDRASVYRAVDLFEKLSIVQRLNTGWKYKIELTDTFMNHHHHLTCTNCARTIALSEIDIETVIHKLASKHHFEVATHQVEIQGLCPACQS